MSILQKQVLDVRLLGMDEKANPREAVAGTIVDADNCIMYKDGRIEKRPGLTPVAMTGRSSEAVTYGRELGVRGSEMMLNDGRKWWARSPVLGQWLPHGYSAHERLDIRPTHTTDAECNGIDSRLQMDSAVIGRYELTVMSGGPTTDSLTRAGWMVTDHTTGAVLVPFQMGTDASAVAWYQWLLDTDGATAESFVGFGVTPTNDTATTHTLRVCVWNNTTEHSTVFTGTIVNDVALGLDNNTYHLHTINGRAACYDCVRVAANVWLLAYHQYNAGTPEHARLVIRKLTRTSNATFTVSEPVTVDDTANTLYACSMTWMYAAGNPQAWLAWQSSRYGADFHCVLVTIATMALGTPFNLSAGDWDHCRGMTGGLVNGTTPFVLLDVDNTMEHLAVDAVFHEQGGCSPSVFGTVWTEISTGVWRCNVAGHLTGVKTDDVSAFVGMRLFAWSGSVEGARTGIYVLDNIGEDPITHADTYAEMHRATDLDTSAETLPGLFFEVTGGTSWGGFWFRLTSQNPIALGTTVLTWSVDAIATPPANPDRQVRVWYVNAGTTARLLHSFGLLTRTFTLPNVDTNEFAVGVFNVSTWQPSAFVLRLRMAATSFAGSTVGAHLAAGDFAGRPMCLQLPHFINGVSLAMGRIRNQTSPIKTGPFVLRRRKAR